MVAENLSQRSGEKAAEWPAIMLFLPVIKLVATGVIFAANRASPERSRH